MSLKAKFWNDFFRKRLDEAANMPFLSLHSGRKEDEGSSAVKALQDALRRIQRDSPLLPPKLRPGLFIFPAWGPFDISKDERDNAKFGSTTTSAVKKFQVQATDLEEDGKAGIHTLHRLDKILAHLTGTGPSK